MTRPTSRLLFLSPIVLLLLLTIFPLAYSIYLSFFRGILEEPIGIQNFAYLLRDARFLSAVQITLLFVGVTVASETIIGLLLAYALFQPEVRGKNVWQTLFLLPLAVPPIVAGVLFKILYHPSFGPSSYLQLLNLTPPLWLETPTLALLSVALINVWMWTPFSFLIFYAGMRAIPREVIEAATIDGASRLNILKEVVLSHIKALVLVVILFRTIDNLTAFDEIMGSTAGGPGFSTTTFAVYVYKIAFKSWDLGYASAASTVLFIITLIMGMSIIRTSYSRG